MRTISWRWHHKVVVDQCTIHLESLLVVRSVPGHFSLNRLDRKLKLVGRHLKMRCGDSFQEKRPHGYPWQVFFITYKSISQFTCIQVTATSLCLGANEERPMRSGHEEFLTGVESGSQIGLKKTIVRRRLAPLSKNRDCQERSPLFKCWSDPHPVVAGFWWG